MSNMIRVAYYKALKHGLSAAVAVLRPLRPLIPEPIRKKLRGHHKSMDVRFAFSPLNQLDQKIASAKGENYLSWYARYKNKESTEETPQALARHYATGGEDLIICKSFGLLPRHRLHEFGTGKGRSAQHFVAYLDPGKYSGNDASAAMLGLCERRLNELGLTDSKRPRLIVNSDNSMDWLGEKVDFIWNYAVITHVPPEDAEAIVGNTAKLMHSSSIFLCSYTENGQKTDERYSHKDWLFSPEFFRDVASRHGLKVEDVSDRLPPVKRLRDYRDHHEVLLKFTLA
jgi:cyclopropane fatty-acyl-phospholipid synthase-like methyltransferase